MPLQRRCRWVAVPTAYGTWAAGRFLTISISLHTRTFRGITFTDTPDFLGLECSAGCPTPLSNTHWKRVIVTACDSQLTRSIFSWIMVYRRSESYIRLITT